MGEEPDLFSEGGGFASVDSDLFSERGDYVGSMAIFFRSTAVLFRKGTSLSRKAPYNNVIPVSIRRLPMSVNLKDFKYREYLI